MKGVDRITYASNKSLLEEFRKYDNFSFVHCDINELKFLYDCDFVINTAAETHVGNSIASSQEFVKSNVDGVHNLLELIKNHRGENAQKPTLIHFSTDEVYGDIEEGAHDEEHLLKPSNPYSATKAAADMLIMAWGRTHKVPLSTDKLVFIDSITSPKLIIVSSISYDPSTLNDQLKLDTFPNIPS